MASLIFVTDNASLYGFFIIISFVFLTGSHWIFYHKLGAWFNDVFVKSLETGSMLRACRIRPTINLESVLDQGVHNFCSVWILPEMQS